LAFTRLGARSAVLQSKICSIATQVEALSQDFQEEEKKRFMLQDRVLQELDDMKKTSSLVTTQYVKIKHRLETSSTEREEQLRKALKSQVLNFNVGFCNNCGTRFDINRDGSFILDKCGAVSMNRFTVIETAKKSSALVRHLWPNNVKKMLVAPSLYITNVP
jgi:hypothetical protein